MREVERDVILSLLGQEPQLLAQLGSGRQVELAGEGDDGDLHLTDVDRRTVGVAEPKSSEDIDALRNQGQIG